MENDNEADAARRGAARKRGLWKAPDTSHIPSPPAHALRAQALPKAVTGAAVSVPAKRPEVSLPAAPAGPISGGMRSLELSSEARDSQPLELETETEARNSLPQSRSELSAHPAQRSSLGARPAEPIRTSARPRVSARAQPRNSLPGAQLQSSSPAQAASTSWPAAGSVRPSLPLIAETEVARRATWPGILLATFGILSASVGGLVLGARAGWWPLPPQAAAMLGLDEAHASMAAHDPRATIANAPAVPQPPSAADLSAPEQPSATPAQAPALAAGPGKAVNPAVQAQPGNADPAEQLVVADTASRHAEAAAAASDTAAESAPEPREPTQQAQTANARASAEPDGAPSQIREAAHNPKAVAAVEESASERDDSSAGSLPADNRKLLLLARAKFRADDLAGAEALLRRGLARDPTDHHLAEELVRVLIDRGRGTEAVKYAAEIVRKRPKRIAYRILQGDAKLLAGDRPGAEAAWRAALTIEPDNWDVKRRLGIR